jgi:hypothetical protein
MRLGVVLAGFFSVMHRVQVVAMRDMGVMARCFVVLSTVVLRRLAMVLGGGLVMRGGLFVMFGQQACIHDGILLCGGRLARPVI